MLFKQNPFLHFCIFMKTILMRSILLTFLLSAIVSCSKDNNSNNSTPDNISTITISTPIANFTYLNGGVLRIEGEINDPDKVASARVQVKNKSTNAMFYEMTVAAGNITRYFFLWNWTITGISSSQAATVTVTARDARNFEISKSVDVNFIP